MFLKRAVLPLSLAGLAATVLLAPAASAAPSTGLVISEVYGGGGNSNATYKNDFIELYNLSSAPISLSGLTVQYFSATGGSGGTTALSGTLPPSTYYLIQEAAGAGGTTNLTTPDAVGTLNLSATNGRVDLLNGSTVLDRVGFGTANAFETKATPALSNTTSASRTPVNVDTDDNSKDFTVGSPSPQSSNGTAGGGGGSVCNASGTVTLISAVQGAGVTSPCDGATVTVDAVVTGLDDLIGSSFGSTQTGTISDIQTFPRDRGFYIEEETADQDSNPNTSEALFVGLPTASTALPAIGDKVRVTGQVQDGQGSPTFGQTAIYPAVGGVVTEASGQPLPAPVVLDAAASAAQTVGTETDPTRSYYETLENMLVTLPVGVANSGGTDKFGELYLTPGTTPGTILRTDPVVPGLLDLVADAGAGNPANPYHAPESTTQVNADKNDTVRNATGPLGFSFGAYSIVPQVGQLPTVEKTGVSFPYTGIPAASPGQIRIASFNQENLFPPGAYNDGETVSQAEFSERLTRASNAIGQLLRAPDVVAVQEIGDTSSHSGASPAYTSQDTLAALATQLGQDGYGTYTAVSREGHDARGIDVGFLVKSTVSFTNVTQYDPAAPSGLSSSCSDAAGKTFNRTPLSIDVTAPAPVGTFTILTNHFASKGNPPECAAAQGTAVHDIVVGLQQQGKRVLVNGDLNSYEDEPALTNLQAGDVLRNQFSKADPRSRYSFAFDGTLGTLDHQLVTPDLEPLVVGLTYAHVDNDYYERADQSTGEGNSDHDPPVLTLGTPTPGGPTAALPETHFPVLFGLVGLLTAAVIVVRRRQTRREVQS